MDNFAITHQQRNRNITLSTQIEPGSSPTSNQQTT
uniref:Uncharacterized protein n=1 Tax=Anguilla anguilla TaxID=7936 RepID=A0A0E9S1A4_ANGAN